MSAPKAQYTWLTKLGDVVKSLEDDDYLTVLLDCGDFYQVCVFAKEDFYTETGWEMVDSTRDDIYTMEDATHEYLARLAMYYNPEYIDTEE